MIPEPIVSVAELLTDDRQTPEWALWPAPVDAGLANASDTSHISDVLDSHPILSDLTAAIAPSGTKGRR